MRSSWQKLIAGATATALLVGLGLPMISAADKAAPAKKAAGAKATAKVEVKAKADAKPVAAKAPAAKKAPAVKAPPPPWVEPQLPGGKEILTETGANFLKPVGELPAGVTVAKTAPTVDVLMYPGQTYEGKPWSNWGDGCFADGKFYSAFGDHLSPQGTGRVFEYDPATKKLRQIVDLKSFYKRPEGTYSPAKIHSRLDMAPDGYIYFSTHRGSPSTTNDTYHYMGDDILRVDPKTAKVEVVAVAPAGKHCIPTSVVDPERMIFYGGTAAGVTDKKNPSPGDVKFLAYDLKNKKTIYVGDAGPPRCIIWAKSTGKVYFVPGSQSLGEVVRFDPANPGTPTPIGVEFAARTCTFETPQGKIYCVASGQNDPDPNIYEFDVKTEKVKSLGPAAIGGVKYIASMDADPTGRYVYYIPGAHGHADRDGTPVIQFDTKTKTKKVIAFLSEHFRTKYGFWPDGTYCTVLSDDGSTLYACFNTQRGTKNWDHCTMAAIHIPESERQP